ncbi:MAG: cytochrome P450 [Chloroflexi bacterium]|nr:cytochrome P450 [Chloroflexota bacterium]
MTDAPQYDLYSPTFKAHAYQTYAQMREQAPVCQHAGLNGENKLWFITRYADCEAVLRDHKRFVKSYENTLTPEARAQLAPASKIERLLGQHLLNMDGTDHTRLRGLINKAFTAQMVNRMQDRVQALADELLDQVEAQGAMDLLNEYAFPLPIIVIAQMLGVPAADREHFRRWSNAFVEPAHNADEWAQQVSLLTGFIDYLGRIFAERRQNPQDDLITALLQAEEAGDKLNEDELYSMVVLLIVAGHETTVNLIGNGTLALLRNPEQLARLKSQPDLMPAAIEEFLRYDGPVERATIRFAKEDVEIGGQLIRRGEPVSVVLASADRDSLSFTQPEQLDTARDNNRHLAFGFGVHYCIGAPLARMEGRIALNTLLRRLPNLRLAVPVEALTWRENPILRGLQGIPVAWG